MSIYAKEFLAIYFAFSEFGHLMWGSIFPVIVFTDNRSVTRFFQTKIIPPPLWNACDYVLQYNFVIAHVAGAMNTAADFLSRAEVNPTEKLEMNIRNDVTTKSIEVNIQSTGVAEEETLYIVPDESPPNSNCGKRKTQYALWQERKPTMIQKTKCQNSKLSINPQRAQSITAKDTSKTTPKSAWNKTMTKYYAISDINLR